jgi:hypothetical protein
MEVPVAYFRKLIKYLLEEINGQHENTKNYW